MEITYSRKDVRKEILNLAWPSIRERLLIMMVGMVSTIFVERISKGSMTAVGITLVGYILHCTTSLGIYEVMIGICADFVARSIMYIFRIRKGSWKYLKI